MTAAAVDLPVHTRPGRLRQLPPRAAPPSPSALFCFLYSPGSSPTLPLPSIPVVLPLLLSPPFPPTKGIMADQAGCTNLKRLLPFAKKAFDMYQKH